MSKKTKSALTLVLLTIVTAFLLLSVLFLVRESAHRCSGENCPVCERMHEAEQAVRQLGGAAGGAVSLPNEAAFFLLLPIFIRLYRSCSTPISSKVRLND